MQAAADLSLENPVRMLRIIVEAIPQPFRELAHAAYPVMCRIPIIVYIAVA